ncbi:MAG: phosphoglycerate dehydrogenase [Chloroflexota bacterium]
MKDIQSVYVTPPMLADMPQAFAPLTERGISVIHNNGEYPMPAAQLAAWLMDGQAAIVGLDELTRDVFAVCPELTIVARNGVGLDNVDLVAATEYGVAVTVPQGANSTSVAELTFGLMISLVRGVVDNHNRVQHGQWERLHGVELAGKTLGIIGLGHIGKKVARRAGAFGLNTIAHDIAPDHDFAREHRIKLAKLEDLLANSHVVTLHVPLDSSTQNMIDAAALQHMRRGAFLINTARGGVVNHMAVATALDAGHLAGVALDVHPDEGNVSSYMLGRANVITTTHVGAYTYESLMYTTQAAVQSIIDVIDGKITRQVLNPEVLQHG